MTNQERALEISATLGEMEKAAHNMPSCPEKSVLLNAAQAHHSTLLKHAQAVESLLNIQVGSLTVGGSK